GRRAAASSPLLAPRRGRRTSSAAPDPGGCVASAPAWACPAGGRVPVMGVSPLPAGGAGPRGGARTPRAAGGGGGRPGAEGGGARGRAPRVGAGCAGRLRAGGGGAAAARPPPPPPQERHRFLGGVPVLRHHPVDQPGGQQVGGPDPLLAGQLGGPGGVAV